MKPVAPFVPSLLCLGALLIGQEPVEPSPAQRGGVAFAQPVTVSLTFAGGTFAKFAHEIRIVQPKANILLAEAARDARLPAIDLRGAGLDQALQGACEVAELKGFEVRVREHKGPGEPVYAITAQPRKQPAPPPALLGGGAGAGAFGAEITTRVFALGRLCDPGRQAPGVQALAAETLLSAIEGAGSDDASPARLRYHTESGLLIVRGTHDQCARVAEVLAVLEQDRGAPRGADRPAPPQAADPVPTEPSRKK